MTTKNDEARAERLKAALRENLRRRKGQVRGRSEAAEARDGPAADAARPDEPDGPAPDTPSS